MKRGSARFASRCLRVRFTSPVKSAVKSPKVCIMPFAVVLAYVFRLDSGETMDMPELTLPPELRFDEYGNLEAGEG